MMWKTFIESVRKHFGTTTEAVAWISLAASFLGLVISIAGIIIAGTSIYLQFFDKTHALYAIVSSYEIQNDEVTFGVVFSNQGDYTEVITAGDVTLSPKSKPDQMSVHELEECFQPITIESRKAIHHYYTVKFDSEQILKPNAINKEMPQNLVFNFSALSPENKQFVASKKIGTITHNLLTRKIKEIWIATSKLTFNFNDKDAIDGLGRMVLPNISEKDEPYGCRRKEDEINKQASTRYKINDLEKEK